jgi:hypothetical protein
MQFEIDIKIKIQTVGDFYLKCGVKLNLTSTQKILTIQIKRKIHIKSIHRCRFSI